MKFCFSCWTRIPVFARRCPNCLARQNVFGRFCFYFVICWALYAFFTCSAFKKGWDGAASRNNTTVNTMDLKVVVPQENHVVATEPSQHKIASKALQDEFDAAHITREDLIEAGMRHQAGDDSKVNEIVQRIKKHREEAFERLPDSQKIHNLAQELTR